MTKQSSGRFSPHPVDWDSVKAQRLWDYYGASPAHKKKYFGESVGSHLVRLLWRRGLFKNAQTIVDFSCGTGALITHVLPRAAAGAKVVGYDPSQLSVQKANQRNRHSPAFVGAYLISTYPTAIRSDSVDLLFLTEVLEHLDDDNLARVLSECSRILSPRGKFVVTTPNEEDLEGHNVLCPECGCTFHMWQHQRSWSADSLKEALLHEGFRHVRVSKITWGNELVDVASRMLRRRATGLLAIAEG
jgi:SAM-dependent methyltransferase